jgi:hypothetical protein
LEVVMENFQVWDWLVALMGVLLGVLAAIRL